MEHKNIKRVIEIDAALEAIAKARKTAPVKDDKFSNYWCSVSQRTDGSGWKLDLTGANLASKILDALYEVMDAEENALKEELKTL